MNFTHLEYAVAVFEHGSISRAAQDLFVSQPYLSNTIKKLEDEIGFQIFHRTRTGITVTEAGQAFISSARKILLEVRKINELSASQEKSPLRVASYYSAFVARSFFHFIRESDQFLSDNLSEMGIREMFQSILSGEHSLGIFFYAPSKRNAYIQMAEEYHCVCRDLFPPIQMYAFTNSTHPLANMPSVTLSDIAKYNYVCYNDNYSLKYLNFLGLEKSPNILQVSDRGSFLDAICTGDYLSINGPVELSGNNNFISIPIADAGLYLNSCYVTSKDYALNPREQDFITYLRQQYAEESNE